MARKISVQETTQENIRELLYHMSVQSLLDLKSIYGRVTIDDLMDLFSYGSTYSVLFGSRVAYIVFTAESSKRGEKNMFVYATTEGYSRMSLMKESFPAAIENVSGDKLCSIVYKGNKKLRSVLKSCGFNFKKSVTFGKENRCFYFLERERNAN